MNATGMVIIRQIIKLIRPAIVLMKIKFQILNCVFRFNKITVKYEIIPIEIEIINDKNNKAIKLFSKIEYLLNFGSISPE